jgi:Flp pilus assembly pilin Flp
MTRGVHFGELHADSPRRNCTMRQKLLELLRQDDGQTAAQYATTLSFITFVCLTAFALVAATSYLT